MLRPVHALAIAAALLSPLAVHAEQPTETRVTDSTREEVIEALGTALQENYVFPEVAESLSAELENRLQSGAYDDSTTAADFAKMLTLDMRTIGKDGHFGVRYDPDFVPEGPGADGLPDEAEIAEMRRMVARHAYGLQRIDRLPGNIGYLDIRGFDEPYYVANAYEAAMTLLAGSDAIIIDLRSNGGGDPASVALLMSHFFPVGTELLVRWLTPQEWPPFWQSLTLMFQREVAARIVAKPGSKAYGRLALLAQWRADARIVLNLPPEAFTPPPKVSSAVVHLTALPEPRFPADPDVLNRVVAAAFNQRRKMLRSALKGTAPDIEDRLLAAGLKPTERAEQVPLEGFCALAREIAKG